MKRILLPLLFLLSAVLCFGQAAMTSTTLSAAVAVTDQTITVASITGFTAPSGVNQVNTAVFIDRELMYVTTVPSSGTVVGVLRGQGGTAAVAHNNGATVWYGQLGYFYPSEPTGSCTAANLLVLPRVVFTTGNVFDCPTSGPNSSLWAVKIPGQPLNINDNSLYVDWSDCQSSVSGNGTGTNGYTVAGASSTPVVQAQTSATGTNTHTYVCIIRPPIRQTTGKGVSVTDVVFFYGVQGSNLGTQAATLASGTMNGSTVFSTITMPTPGASETASTVTPVRADSGSLTITPAVASANTAITTAGAFYSVKFTPSAPIALNTDLQAFLLTVTLQCSGTSATTTNSPGAVVHFISSPL